MSNAVSKCTKAKSLVHTMPISQFCLDAFSCGKRIKEQQLTLLSLDSIH